MKNIQERTTNHVMNMRSKKKSCFENKLVITFKDRTCESYKSWENNLVYAAILELFNFDI